MIRIKERQKVAFLVAVTSLLACPAASADAVMRMEQQGWRNRRQRQDGAATGQPRDGYR